MYTLKYPFRLTSTYYGITIKEDVIKDSNVEYHLDGSEANFHLTASGFTSKDQAKNHVKKIKLGLYWLLLEKDLPCESVVEIQVVTYKDASKPANKTALLGLKNSDQIDGIVDDSKPVIFLTEKNIATLSMGTPSLIIGYSSDMILKDIVKGISYLKNLSLLENTRLITALDLYGACFEEGPSNAKFLTLIMALEALAIPVKRPPKTLQLLEKWTIESKQIIDEEKLDEKEKESIKSICNSLLRQKDESHSQNIKHLVRDTLAQNGDSDANEVAKHAVKIYGLRGDLLHNGSLEASKLNPAISEAKTIVQRVLKAQFISIASQQ
jgi:hypothetical protein